MSENKLFFVISDVFFGTDIEGEDFKLESRVVNPNLDSVCDYRYMYDSHILRCGVDRYNNRIITNIPLSVVNNGFFDSEYKDSQLNYDIDPQDYERARQMAIDLKQKQSDIKPVSTDSSLSPASTKQASDTEPQGKSPKPALDEGDKE